MDDTTPTPRRSFDSCLDYVVIHIEIHPVKLSRIDRSLPPALITDRIEVEMNHIHVVVIQSLVSTHICFPARLT